MASLVHVIAGVRYLIHPHVIGTILEPIPAGKVTAAIILQADTLNSNTELDKELRRFEADDVYNREFAHVVIVSSDTSDSSINCSASFNQIYHLKHSSTLKLLLPGPYFLHGSNIHQAWRLYSDHLDAFVFSVIPEDVFCPEKYIPLDVLSEDGIWKSVAVPSRLYTSPSKEKPFAGSRTALKDIYGLAGVKNTGMSRSYTALYGPVKESSDYAKKLIDLGAVIIGKTKMCQFACSDEPTDQYIDFHCPINPRADGYQSPSGSSSGAAAALAGYDWLDHSIAGDSAGSVRAPGIANGLFALRPSLDTTSLRGSWVNSPNFDVVGLMGRDFEALRHLAVHTLTLPNRWDRFPTKIMYPQEYFPVSNKRHQAMIDQFVLILENFLGTERIKFSFENRWSRDPPKVVRGRPLSEYLEKSAFWSLCRDYHLSFTDFIRDHKAAFGTDAYLGPTAGYRCDVGKNVTDEEYKSYIEELRVFRDWATQHILSASTVSLSDAIIIMPYGNADPKYRDDPNDLPGNYDTMDQKFISPILHAPQLVLPFGQMPFKSRISGRLEHRPVGCSIMGAKGSDLMLIQLAKEAFQKAGWPTKISTGRYMYPVGDNILGVQLQRRIRGHL
ncbi:putative amidase [Biscogniauxia marginata]|nr:putative amidase [Biscogniauxia marginata]